MTTLELLKTQWTFPIPAVVTLVLGFGLLIYLSVTQASARTQVFVFVALLLFVVATMSPMAVLSSGVLFTAHMLQHLVLLLVIPLFLVVALRGKRDPLRSPRLTMILGWTAGVGAMWFWHEPNLCSLSVSSPAMQAAQIATLLGGGYLFWRPIWGAESSQLQPGNAVVYLFSACLACTALGIYITFVPLTVCPIFANASPANPLVEFVRSQWGFSAATDQQLGGLMMWVPACTLYLGAILAQVGRWYQGETAPALSSATPH